MLAARRVHASFSAIVTRPRTRLVRGIVPIGSRHRVEDREVHRSVVPISSGTAMVARDPCLALNSIAIQLALSGADRRKSGGKRLAVNQVSRLVRRIVIVA